MRDRSTSEGAAIVGAAGVVVAAAVLVTSPGVVPSTSFASVALVASVVLGSRGTSLATGASVVLTVVVGGIDEGFGSRSHVERVAVVTAVGVVAVALARLRARLASEAGRAESAATLTTLARRLGDAVNLGEVLEAVVEEGRRTLGAERAWGRVSARGRRHFAASPPIASTDAATSAAQALEEADALAATVLDPGAPGSGGPRLLVPINGLEEARGALVYVRPASTAPEVVADVAEQATLAFERCLLSARRLRESAALQTLQRATAALNQAMTVQEVTGAIVEAGIDGLGADRVVVGELVEDRSALRLLAQHGFAESRLEPWGTFSLALATPLGDAVRERQRLVAETQDDLVHRWPFVGEGTALVSSAMIAIPLVVRNEVVGGAYFGFREPRRFDEQELALVSILAGRCAGALARSRLYERERTIAAELQAQLMPVLPDLPSWLRAAARYLPATGVGVGGDWYQLGTGGDGSVTALVGDVVGHGIPAAAAMGQLRAVAASAVRHDPDPIAVLGTLDQFAADEPQAMLASVAVASLNPVGRTLTYARAGHPPAIHRSAGRARALVEGAGPPLGFPCASRSAVTLPLCSDDVLVLYTDGLVERRRADIDARSARLLEVVLAAPGSDVEAFADHVIDELLEAPNANDDVALLALQPRF